MMSPSLEYSITTFDGLRLFCQRWEPDEDPRGVLCLVHGFGEHSVRYADFAEVLNQAGFVVAAVDLRGHGKSEGLPGHTPSIDAYMEDIAMFLGEVSTNYPQLPVFLFGHSLGGVLVLNFDCGSKLNLQALWLLGQVTC